MFFFLSFEGTVVIAIWQVRNTQETQCTHSETLVCFVAALAALKEKLPKQEEETPSSKYAGKKLSAKEQMEAALDLESDEEEKKVMKQLVDVQGKVDEIISAYAKERAEMSARFQTQLLEVYSQRQALIKTGTATPVASGGDSASTSQSGEHAAAGATGGSGTGIHNFWLDVLKNCGATKMAIEEHDEPVLEYLTDIAWQPMENNEVSFESISLLLVPVMLEFYLHCPIHL